MKPTLFLVLTSIAIAFGARAAEENPPTLPIGATAPDFNLPGVDGGNYSLKDFEQAKLLAVLFTCNHCPTAQYYEERIIKLVNDYRDKGVALVAISPNDPRSVRLDELGWADMSDTLAEMKIRAKDHQFNFPYLYDGDTQAASRAYGPVATPHLFIFDAQRKLRYVGAIDDSERVQHVKVSYARQALDALLAGQEPTITKTKVVGCSVKWAGKTDSVNAYMARLAAEPVTLKKADAQVLKELRKNGSDKFRLVTFWAIWCAPCIAEFSEFVTINRMYRHRDFEIVAVSLNRPDEEAAVLKFLKKQQASFQNYIFASEEREPLINAFNPDWQGEVPYTVLISPEGKILYQESGSINPLALKRTIVKEMNAVKPW